MKFLVVLTNILLALAIVILVPLTLSDNTFSAKYLESVAEQSNTYQILSKILPGQLVNLTGSDDPKVNQEVQSIFEEVLTPQYLKAQTTSTLDQFDALLKSGGKQVTINLDQITNAVKARGYLKDPNDALKPQVITAEQLKDQISVVHGLETTRVIVLWCTILLSLLSLFLSIWRGKYTALGVALTVAGGIEALYFVALLVGSYFALAQLNFDSSVSAFSPLIHTLLSRIATDLYTPVGVLAAGLLVVGIGLLVFGKHLPGIHKVANNEKSPAPTPAANQPAKPAEPKPTIPQKPVPKA